MDDEENPSERRRLRLRLKRANERTKLTATFLNGIGIATVVVGIVAPLANGTRLSIAQGLASGLTALVFHVLARISLALLKDEE